MIDAQLRTVEGAALLSGVFGPSLSSRANLPFTKGKTHDYLPISHLASSLGARGPLELSMKSLHFL
jgi:hypothetical protein